MTRIIMNEVIILRFIITIQSLYLKWDGVVGLWLIYQSIGDLLTGLTSSFSLERTKHTVPDDEYTGIVLVQTPLVGT